MPNFFSTLAKCVLALLFLVGSFAGARAEQTPFDKPAPGPVRQTGIMSGDNDLATTAKFGHHKYDTASRSALAEAGRGRSGKIIQLRKSAAEAFKRMQAAAKQEGFDLIPISGFLTLEYQAGLFKKSVKRRGSERKAAKWVAPPGHSEHHTGWTLDLGDGRDAKTDVDQSFEQTALFQWLQKNAGQFGFEISFPKGNSQGVSYEPWHWRFVGNDEARRLFHPE